MDLEISQTVAAIIGGFVALLTLWMSSLEYRRQGAQRRAEHFLEMRRRLKENLTFKEICDLLEEDALELATLPFKEKRDFLGFFEEVALMMNSGLIRKEVVHYMFGYYAIRCWQSKHFWTDVNRNSTYWALFQDFVDQMKESENSFVYNRRKYKF